MKIHSSAVGFRDVRHFDVTGFQGHSTRTSGKKREQTLRQIPVIDLTGDDVHEIEYHPPAKRQKLGVDDATANVRRAAFPRNGVSSTWQPSIKGPPRTFVGPVANENHLSDGVRGKSCPYTPNPSVTLPAHPRKVECSAEHESDVIENEMESLKLVQNSNGVQMGPYVLRAPSIAPKINKHKTADFFPWTGCGQEDILCDNVIRIGLSDFRKSINCDTNSHGSIICRHMKNIYALRNISILMGAALQRRGTKGSISNASSFKPPPRVTLTDVKREAWLRDLATSTASLRKLGRTIPHGIRGKALLDQCLSKNIPLSRTIWLIRCVGANEIRAFRRKGASGNFVQGGESKWIKDWTLSVEQFNENIISSCGNDHWSKKLQYALRVSAYLYAERLLDQGQYLDWLLSSFAQAPIHELRAWLIVVQIYWQNLCLNQKRSEVLAGILIQKFAAVFKRDQRKPDNVEFIEDNFSHLINVSLQFNPWIYVVPNLHLRANIISNASTSSTRLLQILTSKILKRNKRITLTSKSNTTTACTCQKRHIFAILNSSFPSFDVDAISSKCLGLMQNYSSLVELVMEWASTPYRESQARVYFTVRLFSKWLNLGIDIQSSLYLFLERNRYSCTTIQRNIFRIIGELTMSNTFLVSHYLQWTIARGALRTVSDLSTCDAGLVGHLAIAFLPTHIGNLRNEMLSRTGFSLRQEAGKIEALKNAISANIFREPASFLSNGGPTPIKIVEEDLSYTVLYSLSFWLKSRISDFQGPPIAESLNSGLQRLERLSVQQFTILTTILEDLGDYSGISNLVKLVSSFADTTILASAADTVNIHFDVFMAMGLACELCNRLIYQLQALNVSELSSRASVISLINLTIRLPAESVPGQKWLYQTLIQIDHKLSTSFISPTPNRATETVQPGLPSFEDKFENLLSTGLNLDHSKFEESFKFIMARAETYCSRWANIPLSLILPVQKLRILNAKLFHKLMVHWLEENMLNQHSSLCEFIPLLVLASSITLETPVTVGQNLLSKNRTGCLETWIYSLFFDILFRPMPSVVLNESGLCSYRLAQQRFIKFHAKDTVSIIFYNLTASQSYPSSSEILVETKYWSTVTATIHHLIMATTNSFFNEILEPWLRKSPVITDKIIVLLSKCLHMKDLLVQPSPDMYGTIQEIVNSASYLALPIRRLKLQLLLSRTQDGCIKDVLSDTARAFYDVALMANTEDDDSWTDLIKVLDPRLASLVRRNAERDILSASIMRPKPSCDVMHRWIDIFDAVAYSLHYDDGSKIWPGLIDRLQTITERITRGALTTSCGANTDWTLTYLFALMRLIVVQLQVDSTNSVDNVRTRKTPSTLDYGRHIIPSLASLLISPCIRANFSISTFISDVTSLLIDKLGPDDIQHYARVFQNGNTSRNPRLRYLFGLADERTAWLQAQRKRSEKLMPYPLRQWEIIGEATPNVDNNDTAINLALFDAKKL